MGIGADVGGRGTADRGVREHYQPFYPFKGSTFRHNCLLRELHVQMLSVQLLDAEYERQWLNTSFYNSGSFAYLALFAYLVH